MSGNELTRRRVVLPNDVDQLLGLGGLDERGESAEVEVDDGDLGTMACEELCALVARDQSGDLRRKEARELGLLALDGLEQLRVGIAIALWSANVAISLISPSANGRTSARESPMTPRSSSSKRTGSPSNVR